MDPSDIRFFIFYLTSIKTHTGFSYQKIMSPPKEKEQKERRR